MNPKNLGRRDFHKLSLAAVGGIVAGSVLGGCKSEEKSGTAASGEELLLDEPHVCRGLNSCKGQGAGGGNQCAGTGKCANVKAHSCAGKNECAGQGGCHGTAGMNACGGKGGCAVPLKEDTWKGARAAYEAVMKSAGKQCGPAPAKG